MLNQFLITLKHLHNILKKTANMLLNRNAMSKLVYVINTNNAYILTEEMEKVKII